ncbi:MAG: TetR/AcrR family transcriptional regulator [Pseudomonadota bacterium]
MSNIQSVRNNAARASVAGHSDSDANQTKRITSASDSVTELSDPLSAQVDVTSFASFCEDFPLQGEQLYTTLFDRHSDIIQTQKARFATANLEKIFKATFEVSFVSGFDRMSLRDLSRQTGMSMGAIYSCISKKEDIALMVADIVRLSSELTRQHAMKSASLWSQIQQSIRFHLYASTLLQPWYFFLYFETRSLPEDQQEASMKIELDAITGIHTRIEEGIESGEFKATDAKTIANMIVVLLEDWYLKPWKTQSGRGANQSLMHQQDQGEKLEKYYQSIIQMVAKLLAVQTSAETN